MLPVDVAKKDRSKGFTQIFVHCSTRSRLFNAAIHENIDPLGLHSDACYGKRRIRSTCLGLLNEGMSSEMVANLISWYLKEKATFLLANDNSLCLDLVILRGNRVVLLDEASSSTDGKIDALIQKAVRRHV